MLRLTKSLSEKIYLLYANQISESQWDFKVRGQSKNIYQQTLTPSQFTCSCPDHKTKQTFCKHLLFLVARVAIQMNLASNLSNDKTLWSINYFNDCSKSWIERLKSRIVENQTKSKPICCSAIGNDCPVCFEEMKEGESLAQCITTCKNYFHKECINLWLSSGHNNCPLCRAGWVTENEENVEVILLPTPIKLEDLTTLEQLPQQPQQPQQPKKTRGRKKKTEIVETTIITEQIVTEPVIIKKTRGRKKKTETETEQTEQIE
jgi:hypothetical protein